MTTFADSQTAYDVFGELFTILTQDDHFNEQLQASGLSVRIEHVKPDCVLYVEPHQVQMGTNAPESAIIRIKMSCDTAHRLWLGTLLMPAALATGRIRIKGKVAKVIELVPILQPAFDRYPQIAADHGVTSGEDVTAGPAQDQ